MPVPLDNQFLPAAAAAVAIGALIAAVLAVRYCMVWSYNRRQDSYVKFLLDKDFTLHTYTVKSGKDLRIIYYGVRQSETLTTAHCPELDIIYVTTSKSATKRQVALVMRSKISKRLDD